MFSATSARTRLTHSPARPTNHDVRFDDSKRSRMNTVRMALRLLGARVHGTTGEVPIERFQRAEAKALKPVPGLALVLKKALDDRIAALGRAGSWPEVIADLDSLTETEIEHDGKRFVARSAPRPAASLALRAIGVALPPTIRPVVEN
jgi:hypothetical protein